MNRRHPTSSESLQPTPIPSGFRRAVARFRDGVFEKTAMKQVRRVLVAAVVMTPMVATTAPEYAGATAPVGRVATALPFGGVMSPTAANLRSPDTNVMAADEPAIIAPGAIRPATATAITISSTSDTPTPFVNGAIVTADAFLAVFADVVVTADHVSTTITSSATGRFTVTVTNPDGHRYTGRIDVRISTGEFAVHTPKRVLDTRQGGPASRLAPDETRSVTVGGGSTGLSCLIQAVVVNVTVVDPAADGFLTVWAADSPRPNISSVNYARGQTVANLVTTNVLQHCKYHLSADITLAASTATDVIVDVVGSYAAGPLVISEIHSSMGSAYTPVTPDRRTDTRLPMTNAANLSRFPVDGPIHAAETRTLSLDSAAGEFTGIDAVALNVTVSGPTAPGFLTIWPGDQPKPDASNINFAAGDTIPNMVIVPISALHQLNFYNSAGDTNVIVDLMGVYQNRFAGGLTFTTTEPTRVLDTRLGIGLPARPLAANETATLTLAPLVVVVMNMVITDSAAPTGYVTVYSSDAIAPNVSNLNAQIGRAAANQVIIPISVATGSTVQIFNANGSANLIADVTGYFS
jgi:hypothetical protein